MTVRELYEVAQTPLTVKSGYNGKILCKRFDPKRHEAIGARTVLSVWAEIRATTPTGYSNIATAELMVYADGAPECAKEALR